MKTGSRLLSVTLPLHNSSSGSVTGTRAIARGRRNIRSRASRTLICFQLQRFLFINRRKARLHKRVTQEVIRFCFSKRNIFQPRLDSGNNVPLCCKTFPRRYPRSLGNSYTRVWFFTEKVTNNAGPKLMCLSSSLFVTYFLAVYQKPTNFLYFPLSIMLRVCFSRVPQSVPFVSLRKVKPYPFPRQTRLICDSECVTGPLWIHSNRLTLSVFHELLQIDATICKTLC